MRTNIHIDVPIVCQLHIDNEEDNKKRKRDSDPIHGKGWYVHASNLLPYDWQKQIGRPQARHVRKKFRSPQEKKEGSATSEPMAFNTILNCFPHAFPHLKGEIVWVAST
jgi:hypothetical protein